MEVNDDDIFHDALEELSDAPVAPEDAAEPRDSTSSSTMNATQIGMMRQPTSDSNLDSTRPNTPVMSRARTGPFSSRLHSRPAPMLPRRSTSMPPSGSDFRAPCRGDKDKTFLNLPLAIELLFVPNSLHGVSVRETVKNALDKNIDKLDTKTKGTALRRVGEFGCHLASDPHDAVKSAHQSMNRSVKRKVDNAFNVIEAGLGTVRAGLRIARMGTGAGFETAERLSNSIHPKIEEGVKQAAAYGAAAGSLLGFESTAMASATAGAAPVVGILGVSQQLTSFGIGIAKNITMAGLDVGLKAADTLHESLREYAVREGVGVGAASNHAALAAIEVLELAVRLSDRIPRDRSILSLGEAFMVYGRLQKAMKIPYPPTNAPALTSSPETEDLFLHTAPRLFKYCLATFGYTWNRALGFQLPSHCATPEDIIAYVGGLAREGEDRDGGGVLFSDWDSSVHRCAFACLEDPQLQAIVVAIRGSSNLGDALTDLCCEPDHTCGGHPGIAKSAQDFDKRYREKLKFHLAARPGWRLIITGHSLGAGVAQALARIWQDEPFWEDGMVYAFSAPCAVSLDESLTTKNVISFITGPDLVSRLSYGSVLNLAEVLIKLTEPETSRPGEQRMMYNRVNDFLTDYENGDESVKQFLLDDLDHLRHTALFTPKDTLSPAGRCLMLIPHRDCQTWRPTIRNQADTPFVTPGGAVVLEMGGTAIDLGEIVIWDGMLSDHLPSDAYKHITGSLDW